MPALRSNRHENVRRYRERMRALGFRQIQLWVPDTRSAQFAEECRRQSLLVANDPAEQGIIDELEALQDTNGWQ
jgi:antidote-toxin recognition MazE-like antitoxin